MRCFVAIELPEKVKSTLSDIEEDFKKHGADVKWVKPGNIHLTLKFLGHIKEENAEKVIKTMQTISRRYETFNLDIRGIGAFPNIRSPRVLWVGIENSDTLKSLQDEIERSLVSEGFEKEDKPFTAHLTLGRFRSRRDKEALVDAIKERQTDQLGQMSVKALSLMKSDLHPAGAKYTRLFEASLREKDHTDHDKK